jgi:hypothetical protein
MQEIIALIQNAVVRIIAALRGRKIGADREVRYFVIDVSLPNGSAADVPIEASQQLDRAFNKITGIGFFEVSDGGIPGNYNVGARSNRKTWIDDININAWNANENVGPMDKYIQTDIPYASGDTFFVKVTPNAATTSVLSGQLVLILENSLTELPK